MAKDDETLRERLLKVLQDEDDDGKGKSRDDEDDMIVIRGKAARKFLGIEDDDASKSKGDDKGDDGDGDGDGKGGDDAPNRGGRSYFKS